MLHESHPFICSPPFRIEKSGRKQSQEPIGQQQQPMEINNVKRQKQKLWFEMKVLFKGTFKKIKQSILSCIPD